LIASPSSKIFPNAEGGEDWPVSGGCCGGAATLTEATARSANTAFAQLMLDLGTENVARMANDLGVTAELPIVPSLVLGAGEVSVMDMAAAYSTFANDGTRVQPIMITRVERANGDLVEEFRSDRTSVLSPEQATTVNHVLQQVIDHGTGEAADIGVPAAGKTGTTTENKDAWFVGYTPRLTAAVWMGYAIPREMTEVHGETVQGGNIPARIWKAFMEQAVAGEDHGGFADPGDLDGGRELDPGLETTTVPETTGSPPPSSGSSVPSTGSTEVPSSSSSPPTSGSTPSSSTPVSGGGGGPPGG
jgi:penicillin-binding protein 1A